MNIFDTLGGWFRTAWNAVTGIPGDVGGALSKLWQLIQNQHNAISWIFGYPQLRAIWQVVSKVNTISLIIDLIHKLHQRQPGWTQAVQIDPAVALLKRLIAQLRAWTGLQLFLLRVLVQVLYEAALAYALALVRAERAQRIAADQAEHAAMLKAVAACLATVQQQASSGYNAGMHDRLTTVEKLLNDLADRNPAIRGLVSLLVKSIFDLETIDNPILRFTIGHLLSAIVGHLGIDQATGDLISALLGPLTGNGKPSTLAGVEKDVADRLGALEGQWATFMADGGPEVENAGKQWKTITSLTVDATILGVFALAVADPQAWATAVADTVGAVESDTLDAVISLIGGG